MQSDDQKASHMWVNLSSVNLQTMCCFRPKAPSGSRETAEQIGEQTVTRGHSRHLLSETSKTSGGGGGGGGQSAYSTTKHMQPYFGETFLT